MRRKIKSKEAMVNALVVYTTILSNKAYISGQITRADSRFIPEYNNDVTMAKPFTDEVEAFNYIRKIYNPHERKFKIETAMLPAESFRIPHPFTEVK
jgi:hypothetical protein